MKFITIRIPVIDTGDDLQKRKDKMLEEVREYSAEIIKENLSPVHSFSELFDVIQSFIGYSRAEIGLYAHDAITAEERHEAFIDFANDLHIEKINKYAAERGWTIT